MVMTIISFLLALVLPRIGNSRAKAKHSACLSNLRNLATAMQIYANDNREHYYPVNLADLEKGNPPLLAKVPTCPSDASSYQTLYQVNNTAHAYTLACGGIHNLQGVPSQPGFPQFYSSGILNEMGP